jgi:hypothetical protein
VKTIGTSLMLYVGYLMIKYFVIVKLTTSKTS